ncbi:MAG: DUF983 domain-containing protein [Flavobacteriaceae bacterium]|nr:MAG: DUF983 domain-containing protein [Flavobacteriaceae bacterium]
MFKKGSKLYSIFKNKCPRCHEGDFMVNKTNYKIIKSVKMHENCTSCQLKYMIEPSFFFGAMFVTYGLTIALSVAAFIIAYGIFGLSFLNSTIAIAVTVIAFIPITIRLSRIIWINMFISYSPTEV